MQANLAALNIQATEVTIGWNDQTEGAYGHLALHREGDGPDPPLQFDAAPPGVETATKSGIAPSTEHEFSLGAYDDLGNAQAFRLSRLATIQVTTSAEVPAGELRIYLGDDTWLPLTQLHIITDQGGDS